MASFIISIMGSFIISIMASSFISTATTFTILIECINFFLLHQQEEKSQLQNESLYTKRLQNRNDLTILQFYRAQLLLQGITATTHEKTMGKCNTVINENKKNVKLRAHVCFHW